MTVAVAVGVRVNVHDGVTVGVAVTVAVNVDVFVGVHVGVCVGVGDYVAVAVTVGVGRHDGKTNDATRVCQLKMPLLVRYWLKYQNLQSSTGSMLRLV